MAYAKTLLHVGHPIYVPAWQTYVIARAWNEQAVDAIGPYPLACLAAESNLNIGVEELRKAGMVSVTLVVDGLLGPPISQLKETFHFTRPFKTHYLVDETVGAYRPSKHHRYEIRRAAQHGVEVRILPLQDILDAWTGLYETLISHHRITGLQRFTRESFEALAKCDGLYTVAGFIGAELVSCHLWVQYKRIVWSHLAASSALGYTSSAAYAVYDHSIRHFSSHLINLGGAAGIGDLTDDGLARFKAGFSNRTHTAYLLGSVLDPTTYHSLCAARGRASVKDYFPAYRAPFEPRDSSLLYKTDR